MKDKYMYNFIVSVLSVQKCKITIMILFFTTLKKVDFIQNKVLEVEKK